jgi:hypothetical protein
MHYKATAFIGFESEKEGWQKDESVGEVKLSKGFDCIKVKIAGEIIETEVTGEGSIFLLRDNKMVKLTNRVKGNAKIGDIIFLLNREAESEFKGGSRENFKGAAVKIEIRDQILETRKGKQNIFVKERSFSQEKNSKSLNLALGLIVFVLLAMGTFLGYQKRTENEQRKKFEEIKNETEKKITEIESIRTINIDTALQLAQEAESVLNNSGVAEKKYPSELTELRNRIAEIKSGLGGKNTEYEVAYDTTLILEGDNQFKGMAVKDDLVYLWSASLGQIDMVDSNLKSKEKVVTDERIKLWLGIFNNGEKWYGYDTSKIYEIKRNELVETEIKGINNIGELSGWNGLIYAIDNANQNIIKLTEGNGKTWLKDGTNLVEEATGMSIDSNIWVLGRSGKIYKYNRGIEEKFTLSTITNLSSANKLRTSDKVNFLAYVTDENTVVIYGKDGTIFGKYNFGDNKINDIGVENQRSSILVLTKNGKIYRIKIK